METLIELIQNEFKKSGYIQLKYESLNIWKHTNFSDFWVIDNDEFSIANQSLLFDSLACLRNDYLEAEKNTSVLILQELPNEANKTTNEVIEAENDCYFFKKYILQYNISEWEQLKPNILTVLDKGIAPILMNNKNFELLKQEEKGGPMSLLYSIAHKLPFIMIEAEKGNYKIDTSFSQDSPILNDLHDWIEALPTFNCNKLNEEEEEIILKHIKIKIK